MLLVLLLVLAAVGGWNYHRNYQLEQSDRARSPFAGYDTASLNQLAEAYRMELGALEAEYRRMRGAQGGVRGTQGVAEGIREFERVQSRTQRLRDVTTEVATREARVREIEQELARRESASSGLALHLERLTGLSLPI
jgi:hypothetical protein